MSTLKQINKGYADHKQDRIYHEGGVSPALASSNFGHDIKVAINMNGIKNCVGAFYHPEIVFVDTDTLKTLDTRHFYNGLVEAVKAGCIADSELFGIFKNHAEEITVDSEYLEQIITRSLLVKRDVVQQDEKEQNLRKILNLY